MKSVKREFPNPVLAAGRDDYIESCSFFTTIEEDNITVDADNIVFSIRYTLECKGITDLLEEGTAAPIVMVKSSAASYQKLHRFPSGTQEMKIAVPKYSVVNKVDVTGSIIASCAMPEFICKEEFNSLYFSNTTFDIRKGDILATEDAHSIFVDDTELEKPLSSIFEIRQSDEQEKEICVSFEGEKIEISLKSELNTLYREYVEYNSGALRRYATGVVVYPALVEALGYVLSVAQNGEEADIGQYAEKRWFRALEHKAAQSGIDLENSECCTTLANEFLGNIALDAMRSFKEVFDSEVNSGETQMIGGID